VNNLQCFVGYDKTNNEIIISFRGSHNIPNWIDNLDTISVKYRNIKGSEVHRGFYELWMLDLYPHVMPVIQSLINEKKGVNIALNGHSMGGAVAQFAALSIYDYITHINNSIKIACYTFGSPRWGNKMMANYFNARINVHWRIVNEEDIVPTVPFRRFGFYHTSTAVWYTDDNSLTFKECAATDGEDSKCRYIGYSAKDHLNYLNVYESCDK
jgi:predicted lipase